MEITKDNKNCIICNTSLKYGEKYCSFACYFKDYRKPNFQCTVCSKRIHVRPFRIKKGIKYCSNTCKEKEFTVWNKGVRGIQHHTEETRRKIAEALSGEKNYAWQGGLTPEDVKFRCSVEYKLWRDKVYKRDNYTCLLCGCNKSGFLNADHIKPFNLYPELRLEVSNGRTLCIECHRRTPTYGRGSRNVMMGVTNATI